MRNISAICNKELQSYFRSPIAYVLLALFGLVSGFFFWAVVSSFVKYSMESQLRGGFPMNVNEMAIRPILGNISVVGLFLIPMITMRLFAEEKRSGTIELLVTSPIHDWEIILGKFFAALIMYACLLGMSALNVGLLFAFGNPDWRPVVIGYLGLFLQGASLLAIGTFLSTLSKNQIVAAVSGFAIALLLYVLDWVTSFESATWAKVLSYLSVLSHYESFAKGVLDSKDFIYYISAIFLGLFLTARSIESMRWRA